MLLLTYTSVPLLLFVFFFFNDTATTEIYTLSLHDALPICRRRRSRTYVKEAERAQRSRRAAICIRSGRSEEHTSELQSHSDLVCRLLLEKKKKQKRADSGRLQHKFRDLTRR